MENGRKKNRLEKKHRDTEQQTDNVKTDRQTLVQTKKDTET